MKKTHRRLAAIAIATVASMGMAQQARGQQTAQSTAPEAREIAHYIAARAVAMKVGPMIWPGFRPDTIPLQIVLPNRGALLLGWRGERPSTYAELSPEVLWIGEAARGAASTATELESRPVAQAVVTDTSLASLAGLIAHESFHVFEGSVRRDDVRFGQGENSYYVSRYPVFDVANETRFALELALLRDALQATTASEARTKAKQFVAVRFTRQHDMDTNVAEFEAMTEMNEGLAEYALLRGGAAAYGVTSSISRDRNSAVDAISSRLNTLLSATNLSVRLRFYVTGSAQALLLDRIGPADWKSQIMRRNMTLQELLAEAVGAPTSPALVAAATATHPVPSLEDAARQRVNALRASVRARADSLMHAPGVHLTLDLTETGFNSCGFDPQNMLQLGDGAILHTRWLKVCQHGIDLEFNTPVLVEARRVDAVIGVASAITLSADGKELGADASGEYRGLKITSAGVTGTIAHARVARTGTSITITPMNP